MSRHYAPGRSYCPSKHSKCVSYIFEKLKNSSFTFIITLFNEIEIFQINYIKIKVSKAFNLTFQIGCGWLLPKFWAAPAGADGGAFRSDVLNKFDLKQTTKSKLKTSIKKLIN